VYALKSLVKDLKHMDAGHETEIQRYYNVIMTCIVSLKEWSFEVINIINSGVRILTEGPYDDYYLGTMQLSEIDCGTHNGIKAAQDGFFDTDDSEKNLFFSPLSESQNPSGKYACSLEFKQSKWSIAEAPKFDLEVTRAKRISAAQTIKRYYINKVRKFKQQIEKTEEEENSVGSEKQWMKLADCFGITDIVFVK